MSDTGILKQRECETLCLTSEATVTLTGSNPGTITHRKGRLNLDGVSVFNLGVESSTDQVIPTTVIRSWLKCHCFAFQHLYTSSLLLTSEIARVNVLLNRPLYTHDEYSIQE